MQAVSRRCRFVHADITLDGGDQLLKRFILLEASDRIRARKRAAAFDLANKIKKSAFSSRLLPTNRPGNAADSPLQ
jgi:hypothetical protein